MVNKEYQPIAVDIIWFTADEVFLTASGELEGFKEIFYDKWDNDNSTDSFY